MERHPWVAEADHGVRFGVILTGARGVTLRQPGDPGGGWPAHDEPLQEILATARLAEDVGLDSVLVPDAPRTFVDPVVSLTALALTTRRLRIGTAVIVAPLRHPALLARMLTDIDRLSNGRLYLGLGIGETEDQFRAIGAQWGSARERQDALAEVVDVLSGIWTGQPFDYAGHYFQCHNMQVQPGLLQQPRPPIMIGGSGKRTLRQVARSADACNLFGNVDEVRASLAFLDGCCDAIGRPREDVLRSAVNVLVLARTQADAEDKARATLAPEVYERWLQGADFIVGTPERAIAHYQAMLDAGVQHFTPLPTDTADHETVELLATEVVPRLSA